MRQSTHEKKFILVEIMIPKIKKFTVTYNTVPHIDMVQKTADKLINSENRSKKEVLDQTIGEIERDLPRVQYVDFSGKSISDLKKDWLVTGVENKPALAENVSPYFNQGDHTGQSIGQYIYNSFIYAPYIFENNEKLEQIIISFAYKNKQEEPCGFSFIAWKEPNADKYQQWIISTIQKTTAAPDKKIVTVFTASDIGEHLNPTTTTDVQNSLSIELKPVINNDTITTLLGDMFNADNSLNSAYIDYLNSRIVPNQNIDDRYRKEIQLNTLFALAKSYDLDMESDEKLIQQQIAEDINFFEDDCFITQFDTILKQLATKLKTISQTTKPIEDIEELLANIAVHRAHFMQLADDFYLEPEKSAQYETIAKTILFCGSALESDKEKDMLEELDKLYQNAPDAAEYYAQQRNDCYKLDNQLKQLARLKTSRFLERNGKEIKDLAQAMVGIGVIVAIVVFLFPIPLLSLIILTAAIGTIFSMATGLTAYDIYNKEQTYHQARKEGPDGIFNIKREHNKRCNEAERPKIAEQKKPTDDLINNKTRTKSSGTSSTRLSANHFALYCNNELIPNSQKGDLETRSELDTVQEQTTRPRNKTM